MSFVKRNSSSAYDEPYEYRASTISAWNNGRITLMNQGEVLSGLDTIVAGAGIWPDDIGSGDVNNGGLVISKVTYDVQPQYYERRNSIGTQLLYRGPLAIVGGDTLGLPSMVSLDSRIARQGLGTTAIARTLPTNPSTDLARAIGELRKDGLPRIPGSTFSKRPDFRSVGDEYLNNQFALQPTISDLRSLAETVRQSETIIEQFKQKSGQKIRKRYQFPSETFTEIYPNRRITFGGNQGSPSNGTIAIRSSKDTWFSGAYRYYVPHSNSLGDRVKRWEQEANKLLGLRPSPKLVWELTPWSWAADWVTNTGDLLRNISALSNDSMVLQYGYLMQKITYEVTYTFTGPVSWGGGIVKNMSTYTRELHEVKSRIPATPYGFGVDLGSFTPTQWSILGALGLSRSPGSLARR